MNYYLGLDTSAYTTSLAIVNEDLQIIADERMLLEVEPGSRGMRQSRALFLHIKNLPILFERVGAQISERPAALAVSTRPRPLEGSYMPVFNAGHSQARVLSAVLDLPLYAVSHQEGHIMAGIINNRQLMQRDNFLAVHFSGGTSEILTVRGGNKNFFDIEAGLTGRDLHAGQLVDRIGVAMGLPFPAGRELEKLAMNCGGADVPHIPAAVNSEGFSFSGAENQALRLLETKTAPEDVAFAVFRMIANTLEKALLIESSRTGLREVLLVGGVMANSLVKKRLMERLEHPAVGLKLYFAEPGLSTDNAVGVALICSRLAGRKMLTEVK